MITMRTLIAAGVAAVAVTLAGCSAPTGGMGPMNETPSTSASAGPTSAGSSATPARGPHDDADVMFAQMMIPHHRQAVEMADMIVAKPGIAADVTALATQIKAAQGPQIDQMAGWLTGWGASVTPAMDMGHDTGGMMSQADMDALDHATGDQAARLFLTGMIRHHRGAIDMAAVELASGQNADAKKLAQSITDTQQVEIDTMTKLLTTY